MMTRLATKAMTMIIVLAVTMMMPIWAIEQCIRIDDDWHDYHQLTFCPHSQQQEAA
jgi:hypothetical protein